jgi:hypothetical protein
MGSTVNSTSSAHSSPSTSLDDVSSCGAGHVLPISNLALPNNNNNNNNADVASQSSSKINAEVEDESATGFVVYQKVRHNSAIDSLLYQAANGPATTTTTTVLHNRQETTLPSASVENLNMDLS